MRTEPVRVALFFTTLNVGGAERQALNLIGGLDRARVRPVVYAVRGGELVEDLSKLHVPTRIAETRALALAYVPLKVRAWLREDQINVLHSLLWHTNLLSRAACLGTTVKCINSVRWAERRPRDAFDYLTRSRVDWWTANSAHGAALARLPQNRTTIINNGLDETFMSVPLLTPTQECRTVTMVAQFRREKRYDTFLKAAALLPQWTFQCVGAGARFDAMNSLALQLGTRNVRFLGKRGDILEILRSSAVGVLLSDSEGSPNAALEAMALGLPFIGSNIPAHRELLGDGRGDLVDQGDPHALAQAIRAIEQALPSELMNRQRRTRSYVREHYSLQRMVDESTALYERMSL